MEHINIRRISGDPRNVRQTKADKDQHATLVASMKAIGLLSPIHVTPADEAGHYQVVAGHRRFAAACELGWDTIAAIIVNPGTDTTLVQLSENLVRADINPLDVWVAVDRMLNEGMTPGAVALALNLTEKRVHHLRAMGSMHPSIVAAIRKRPDDMPTEREVRMICQAPHAKQAEAFKNNGPVWYRVAAACEIEGFPRKNARFDLKLYTGEIHRDLFNDEADELLVDAAQALRLQTEWRDKQMERAKVAGYLLGEVARDQWGSTKPPPGCGANSWEWKRERLDKVKIAKAKRGSWVYTCTIKSDGYADEVFFPVKEKAVAKAASEEIAEPVTKKGAKLIEQLKRKHISDMLDQLPSDQLMFIAALAIFEQGNMREIGKLRDHLFSTHGQMLYLGYSMGYTLLVQALRAMIVRDGRASQMQLALIERIGAIFSTTAEMPTSHDNLAMVKRPGLQSILRALSVNPDDFKTQVAMRDGIRRARPVIDHTHLPALGFDARAPLGYGWPVPQSQTASHMDDDADEDGGAEGGEAEAA